MLGENGEKSRERYAMAGEHAGGYDNDRCEVVASR